MRSMAGGEVKLFNVAGATKDTMDALDEVNGVSGLYLAVVDSRHTSLLSVAISPPLFPVSPALLSHAPVACVVCVCSPASLVLCGAGLFWFLSLVLGGLCLVACACLPRLLNPKPQTLNPKSQTLNLNPKSLCILAAGSWLCTLAAPPLSLHTQHLLSLYTQHLLSLHTRGVMHAARSGK
jgi:hypothetical protein